LIAERGKAKIMNSSEVTTKIELPQVIIEPPGPISRELHSRARKYMKGYSS